jgi:hypothetical protein
MRLIKWWHGITCFGFALYTWPWLDRNPVLGFSKAGGWGVFVGRWSYQRDRRSR